MRPYDQLTTRGQARRLRWLAADALDAYGLRGATFRLIANWENATFRVDVPSERRPAAYAAPFVPGRYLLRLHRPYERTLGHIESEFAWLAAINGQALVTAPIPVHTRNGQAAYQADNADYPGLGVAEGQRVCSLLRWVPGRLLKAPQRRPEHMRRLGVTLARLHNHTAVWQPAKPMDRVRWDPATIMGRNTAVGIAPDVWDELPPAEHDLHARCEQRLAAAADKLGQSQGVFGLIHADLHLGNTLFVASEARPIDFDDAGFAHHLLDLAVTALGLDPPAGPRPWQDALVAGYRSARPLSDDALQYLDVFFAARQSSLLLWCQTNARDRANFRAALPGMRKRLLPDIKARLGKV